ncbi:MAG: DUF4910 domain-containing protein [Eubacterium sp.]|nr:DUF4910 domain-containing protein [Eubacterium sp.]
MEDPGKQIYRLAGELFPICRSITGNGVRQTLKILQNRIPQIQIEEVPSGTKVFDWEIPKEWNISEGYIADSQGRKIIDLKESNLHIMGYSVPTDQYVSLDELKKHIFTEPSQPDVIPYVTSYYHESFGFCMSEHQKNSLPQDTYHMVIKSTLTQGSLSYGELIIPGECSEEIFFSTYICHPSMANNECSGPALAVYLAQWLMQKKARRYTYRFVFVPETIGSICYLSRHKDELKARVIAGFNLSCVGDNFDYSMVESRYGNTLADRVLKNVLRGHCQKFTIYPFLKRGSDERQYNAPGIDLPVVSFCRSKYGEYPQYHTSADNMDYISPEGFQGSFDAMAQVIELLEYNRNYQIQVLCEPQLGRRGLYPSVSRKGQYDAVYAITTLIAYADGTNDLIAISDRIGCPAQILIPIVKQLLKAGLLAATEENKDERSEPSGT